MSFDGYGSHIYVFEKIFQNISINSVLEFGMGLYSTKFFTDHCEFVASIEQESMEWYTKTTESINSQNWYHRYEAEPEVVFDHFDNEGIRFDLVFSDGLAETRCRVANMAMQRKIPLVVLHDTEKICYYGWNMLQIPVEYFRFDFRRCGESSKVTTILTNRYIREVNNWEISEHERIIQAYLSPLQPVVQMDFKGNVRMLALKGIGASV
jgi:hypothetical protein